MIISGKILALLVVLLQASLVQSKSLRKPRQGLGGLGGNRQTSEQSTGADSSCSPNQDQLDFYSQLRSTAAVNGLSGNTLHYNLRAMEAHNNRTVSVTTAAEDNAVITNITDESRFIPAGMETTNKVVCAQILQELDAAASVISNKAVCPWDYICDYKADRYPHYYFIQSKMYCNNELCTYDGDTWLFSH